MHGRETLPSIVFVVSIGNIYASLFASCYAPAVGNGGSKRCFCKSLFTNKMVGDKKKRKRTITTLTNKLLHAKLV